MGLARPAPDATITIASNNAPTCDGRTFDVNVNPPELHFKLSEHPQAFLITWGIVSDGYLFKPNTTVPDPKPQPKSVAGEINSCGAANTEMHCTDNAKNTGGWKYNIPGIVDKDGCPVPDPDPIINND